jgi:ribose 5-phosphate isomerase A
MSKLDQKSMKILAAKKALESIDKNLLVGMGTGSTVECLIDLMMKNPLKIPENLAFSSKRSQMLLKNFSFLDITGKFTQIDLYLDGADHISHEGLMIKGGGGALLREKILMQSAKKSIIMIDETKWVSEKKKVLLPIEILPFAYPATLFKVTKIIQDGNLRKDENGNLYVTDNGNYIFDAKIMFPDTHLIQLSRQLKEIAGVVETGLFYGFHLDVITAYSEVGLPVKKVQLNS